MPGDRKGETLNTSGDRLIPTTGIHGGDISSQRVDELDSLCLNFVLQLHRAGTVPIAVDLGGGCGAQSRRMAELGADVVLIDLTDQRSRVSSFNKSIGRDAIHFYKRDVTSIDFLSLSASFNVIYSQRMMGCIRYGDLDKLFRNSL